MIAVDSAQLQALLPVLALIAWTIVMAFWMLFTRIPAMQKLKIHPQKGKYTDQLADLLPDKVRNVSDNYNHLMEQPTIFYALAFYVALTGGHDHINVALLWAYVVLRIVHSIIQATVNIVPYRFYAFISATLMLIIIVVREIFRLFMG